LAVSEPWLRAFNRDLLHDNLQEIPNESVDLAVFSPPYKKKDGYSDELMRRVGKVLGRVLKPGGMVFMNFGQLSEGITRPFTARARIQEGSVLPPNNSRCFLHAGQTIIWVKSIAVPSWKEDLAEAEKSLGGLFKGRLGGVVRAAALAGKLQVRLRKALAGPGRLLVRGHSQPINSDYLLYYNWEFVFTYYKSPRPKLDRLAIGVEYSDKSNLRRGTRGKHGDVRCAGDTWFIPYKTTGATKKKKHDYEYPRELVRRCVRLAGAKPGDTLYEPFLGSGTSVCVAKELGLNAYASERDAETIKGAVARWEET
jgi:hypothetical protein